MRIGQLWGALAVIGMASGCAQERDLPDRNNIYYAGVREPEVLCAASVDDKYNVSVDELGHAMARAHSQRDTLHLYAHDPGHTISMAHVESVLAMAAERGMDFVTYAQLGTGGDHGSLALSFDDDSVDDWTMMRPLLDQYHARVTFFVTHYLDMTDAEHQQLKDLEADGHDIEFHTVAHLNAPQYVAMYGIQRYLDDEITPALEAMKNDGYDITSFAYPYGARTPELDAALTPLFEHIRAISSTCPRH